MVEVEEMRSLQILGLFSRLKNLLIDWIWGCDRRKGFKDDFYLISVYLFFFTKKLIFIVMSILNDIM